MELTISQKKVWTVLVIAVVLAPLIFPSLAAAAGLEGDGVLKGSLSTFGQKVSRLADIVMLMGALGALLGFAIVGARMTIGGWNMENLKQCKTSVMVIMLGVLLALSSKILAGVIYQAVR